MKHHRGLTLMEVLVAIALIAALFASIFVFHSQLVRSRDAAVQAAARDAGIDHLFESMEAALLTSVGAGFSGSERSLALECRSVPLFTGSTAMLRDRERRVYRFDSAARRVVLRREVGGAPPREGELLADVGRVRFRYHDGDAWRETFRGSGDAALPVLVEIAIWFAGEGDDAPDELFDDALEAEDSDEVWDPDLPEVAPRADLSEPFPDRLRVIHVPDARPRGEEALP